MSNRTDSPMGELTVWMKIEIGYQIIFFLIGSVVNVRALRRTVAFLRSHPTQHSGRLRHRYQGRMVRLSLHLIVANLLVLWIYTTSKTVWMFTFYWYGGDVLCRLLSFSSVFGLQLWSNMVVAIAVDTFFCTIYPFKAQCKGADFTKMLISIAYALACLLSVPQLVIRGDIEVPGGNETQCYIIYWYKLSVVIFYGVYHTVVLFFLPLIVILFCYGAVAWRLLRSRAKADKSTTPLRRHRANAMSSVTFCDSNSTTQEAGAVRGSSRRARSSARQLLKISVPIIGTYVVTWLPYQLMAAARVVCITDEHCSKMLEKLDWLEVFVLASTCINPFLYRFREPQAKGLSTGEKQTTQGHRFSTLKNLPLTELKYFY